MDYMRELATKTLPWFGIDRSADAPAPRNERGEAIDRDQVRRFVDDVQVRLEKYAALPAWLAFLKAANLESRAQEWASLWQSGTEQARVELLADLYYIDASACKDAAVYDVASAYANPAKHADPSGTSSTVCLAERAASLLDLTPSLIKEVIGANRPSEWEEEPTSEEVAGERGRWIQSPRDVRDNVKNAEIAAPFELVLEEELAAIARSRVLREATDLQGPIEDARRHIDQIRRELDLAHAAGAPTPPSGVPIPPLARGAEAPKQLDESPEAKKDVVDELPTRRATLQSELDDWTERLKSLLADSPPGDTRAVPGATNGDNSSGKTVTRYAPRRAEEMNLLGLSFSGGGIRSATFNLGILQALADFDLLRRFDYLSTVSGGGYIGAWLAGCIKREDDGIRGVQRWLSSERSPDPEAPQRRPLRFLREYSNYLTPSIGFLSADSWTMVAIWLRNTLLNQLVLVLFLGAALLLPIVLGSLAFAIDGGWDGRAVALSIAGVALLVAGFFTGRNLRSLDADWLRRLLAPTPKRSITQRLRLLPRWPIALRRGTDEVLWWAMQGWVQTLIVVPIFIACYLLVWPLVHAGNPRPGEGWLPPFLALWFPPPPSYTGFFTILLFLFSGLTLIHYAGRFQECYYPSESTKQSRRRASGWIFLYSVISSAVGSALFLLAVKAAAWLDWFDASNRTVSAMGRWQLLIFGPPTAILILAAVVTLYIGLLGANLPDMRREWWSRLGAWLLIYSSVWIALSSLAIWTPVWAAEITGWIKAAGGFVWVVTTIAGVVTGRSPKTQQSTQHASSSGWRNLVATAAPYVFVIGLLFLVALGVHALANVLRENLAFLPPINPSDEYWSRVGGFGQSALPLVMFFVFGLLSALLASRVDVNEFSMHHFYRNRLVRCYLGATRKMRTRTPSRFTGFDPDDDFKLSDLGYGKTTTDPYVGPYPIFNATLNVVRGSDLAAQERKGESFILTPQYCGYNFVIRERVSERPEKNLAVDGYRPTGGFAYSNRHGVSLGTAMAISGAAANPNMGYHTSAAASFLMTVFNARLGWWVGNPRHRRAWKDSSPHLGLLYHLAELTANTSDRRQYVNLSDGGHFENLGVYELVRRRCRFIVACDSEEDASYRFGGLGSVVRKCRADFGIEIDIRFDRLRPAMSNAGPGRSPVHCVVGEIRYPGGQCGTLLYIKSTLTSDEPADVLEYAGREKAFPHQSTADQWFSESQFESYRALGRHVGSLVFRHAIAPSKGTHTAPPTSTVFARLKNIWYPPSAAIEKHFVDNARGYEALLERVRTNDSLKSFDPVLFPAWNGNGKQSLKPSNGKRGANGNRDRFYTYQAMIELMQNVYIDLELEDNLEHPYNEGWKRIFLHWASDDEFKAAWGASRATYSSRFQQFCSRELGLLE